jgi:hypothetical protein
MDQFGFDDHECRQYASTHIGGASAAESPYMHQIPMRGPYAPSRASSPKSVSPPPPAKPG